ncbi:MAG: peptide chain release factor N(5)-glutamine methyltransferase [Amphiplicatus sp.]
MTLDAFLRAAAARLVNSETPSLDARVLAKHALDLDDAGLILDAKRALTPEEIAKLTALVERRAAGEPVAYIIGEKEFRGLTFRMAPGVLVPRPDSETLIEAAVKRLPADAPLRILDLGTGTGCLLCALVAHFTKASGVGVDLNETALALAETNAASLGLADRTAFVKDDWAAAVEGTFDLIISNPPYIEEGARESLPVEVRAYEDPRALFAGEDGLDAYRAILAGAPSLARPRSLMIFELGEGQAEAVGALAKAAFPGAFIEFEADLAGRRRALVAAIEGQKNI